MERKRNLALQPIHEPGRAISIERKGISKACRVLWKARSVWVANGRHDQWWQNVIGANIPDWCWKEIFGCLRNVSMNWLTSYFSFFNAPHPRSPNYKSLSTEKRLTKKYLNFPGDKHGVRRNETFPNVNWDLRWHRHLVALMERAFLWNDPQHWLKITFVTNSFHRWTFELYVISRKGNFMGIKHNWPGSVWCRCDMSPDKWISGSTKRWTPESYQKTCVTLLPGYTGQYLTT